MADKKKPSVKKETTKIKKEDRAYLYFRENSKGGLNIKFGPDKYGNDTEKFNQILSIGVLKCVAFLSGLTKEEPLEFRRAQYENIAITFQAIFDEAFPDVFQAKLKEAHLDDFVVKAVEDGETVTEEFQEKIDMAKEEVKKRIVKKDLSVLRDNKELSKVLEEQAEYFAEAIKDVDANYYPDIKGDEEKYDEDLELKIRSKRIVKDLLMKKFNELTDEMMRLSKEGKSE